VTTGVGLLPGLLADLADESAAVDDLVTALDPAGWRTPTPADGWTVAHQIAHLAWTDDQALLALRSPEAFAADLRRAGGHDSVDEGARTGARLPPAELLERWRQGRSDLLQEVEQVREGDRIPWFGPPMSASSLVTARLMETWAHGLDVADALGVAPRPTGRVRHVAHLGIRTRDYAFAVHGQAPPRKEFRVELTGPSGELWTWGPEDANDRLSGDAVEFALVVTQRINRQDTRLLATGQDMVRWLDIAQAFAGPPGRGRPARRA
jgi:uncharacterized protein (TIGR03084 family)